MTVQFIPMFTWQKLENPQHNLTMTAGILTKILTHTYKV
jgi:hypothetical protein